jgi:hypothetical protein
MTNILGTASPVSDDQEADRERTWGERNFPMTVKRIGEMNGRWAMLFKSALVIIPVVNALFLPWAVWVTTTLWDANSNVKQFKEVAVKIDSIFEEHRRDMDFMRKELKEVDARIDDMPPTVWKAKITQLEVGMEKNSDDHTKLLIGQEKISASIDSIKEKLGVQPKVVASQ